MMKGSDKMHIKKLASTLMKKNLIVTFTVVTAISLGILTGCGAYQQANADPLTQPTTQIEQMVEDEHQENEASGDVSGNATQETTESTQESSTESSTQEETQDENQDNIVSYHTETQIVHHDAVTHTEQQLVREAWDETVVDQAAWDETVTTYTSEPQVVHHDAETRTESLYCETCRDCGAHFTDHGAAIAHIRECEHMSGLVSDATEVTVVVRDAWDETVYVQVPHTEVVHHDAVTHVVHHEAEYKTVTVVDREAWDEEVEVQVPNN